MTGFVGCGHIKKRNKPTGIVDIDHEYGTLDSIYTSKDDASSYMSLSPLGAMRESAMGLMLTAPSGAKVNGYVQKDFAAITNGIIRCRFWFGTSPTLSAGATDTFWALIISGSATQLTFIPKALGGTKKCWVSCNTDTVAVGTAEALIPSTTPHLIEIYEKRATVANNDGVFRWWCDGVMVEEFTNVNNYSILSSSSHLKVGAVAGLDTGTVGNIYFDEIVINNTGEPIGW